MNKLAKDMTLGEIIEHCKAFKNSCTGCDFMNKLRVDPPCCIFKLNVPEHWDIDNIQVTTINEDDKKLYEKFKDLSDEKKFEYFKKCYEQEINAKI